jgi:hypothetical protein
MAAQPPPSSSSSRRSRTGDKAVGSFSIEDEIGKGSFATVYRGTHKVCLILDFDDVQTLPIPSSMSLCHHRRAFHRPQY